MGFTCEQKVRLYDTDAAGFLFFGSQFRIAHAALEEFLEHLGLPIAGVIRGGEILLPVVHAEADFRAPLRVGDRLTAQVEVQAIGDRSFSVACRLLLPDGREAGSVLTVHAALDAATGTAHVLPETLRAALEPFLKPAS